jgi:triacylglycerol lipase
MTCVRTRDSGGWHEDNVGQNDPMQKPLPRQTSDILNPPANVRTPYAFLEHVRENPLQPHDTAFNLRAAWWFADAALLAYSSESAIDDAFRGAAIAGEIHHFRSALSTQAYLLSADDVIVLAFRGTQVDSFWSSILDFAIDAQFFPIADSHGDLVHKGFLAALNEVWTEVAAKVLAEQARHPRPFWITGHSLGAALATLAANRCSDDSAFGLRGLYTYGSPRVGDEGFGARIRVPVYRFRNDSDLVPHIPIGLIFRHVGKLQFLDAGGHLHRDVPAAMELMLDLGAGFLSIRDAAALKEMMRPGSGFSLPVPGLLADHAPINYSVLVWNCYDAAED